MVSAIKYISEKEKVQDKVSFYVANDIKYKANSSACKLRCSSDFCNLNRVVILLSDKNFEVQKNTLKKMLLMDKKYEVLNVSNFYKEYFA